MVAAIWRPSRARTLVLGDFVQPTLYGIPLDRRQMEWPGKASGSALDYAVDLTAWQADGADQVDAVTAEIIPSGGATDLAVQWISIIGPIVVLMLAGGTAAATYRVVLTLATRTGRILTLAPTIDINPWAPSTAPAAAAAPPNSFLLDAGAPLIFDSSAGFLLDA